MARWMQVLHYKQSNRKTVQSEYDDHDSDKDDDYAFINLTVFIYKISTLFFL